MLHEPAFSRARSTGQVRLVACLAGLLLALFTLGSCKLITPYDPISYMNATNLKVDSLALLDRAADPASEHAVEIEETRINLLKAFEYERGKELNTLTAEQWRLMVSESDALMGEFIVRWKSEGPQTQALIDGTRKNVSKGFDEIIRLERRKASN